MQPQHWTHSAQSWLTSNWLEIIPFRYVGLRYSLLWSSQMIFHKVSRSSMLSTLPSSPDSTCVWVWCLLFAVLKLSYNNYTHYLGIFFFFFQILQKFSKVRVKWHLRWRREAGRDNHTSENLNDVNIETKSGAGGGNDSSLSQSLWMDTWRMGLIQSCDVDPGIVREKRCVCPAVWSKQATEARESTLSTRWGHSFERQKHKILWEFFHLLLETVCQCQWIVPDRELFKRWI